MPRIKAYAALPGTLNIGLINLENIWLNLSATFVYESNSVAMKNGNNAGTTLVAHNFNPFLAAVKLELEKITKKIVKHTNIIGNRFLFKETAKI